MLEWLAQKLVSRLINNYDMLHLVSLEIKNGRQITQHNTVVICDENKNPLVIVVEYEPGLVEVLTQHDHPVEFQQRLAALDFGLKPAVAKQLAK